MEILPEGTCSWISVLEAPKQPITKKRGRLMWQQGIPIETIASIMGHSSIETTLRYIGINLFDQVKAVEAVRAARHQMMKVAQNVPIVTVPGV